MIDQNPTIQQQLDTANGLTKLYNGRYINLFDIHEEDVAVEDICHALSRLCRFNGQVAGFLSVAGHSINCAKMAIQTGREDVALECLMHDAAEAYIGDLVRPLKHHDAFREAYFKLESSVEVVIARVLGLNYPFDPYIKEMDNEVLKIELATDRWDHHREDEPRQTARHMLAFYHVLREDRV